MLRCLSYKVSRKASQLGVAMQFVHTSYAILAFVQLESHFARVNQERKESCHNVKSRIVTICNIQSLLWQIGLTLASESDSGRTHLIRGMCDFLATVIL